MTADTPPQADLAVPHDSPGTTAAQIREESGVRLTTMARVVGARVAEVRGWEETGEVPDSPAGDAYWRIIIGFAEQMDAGSAQAEVTG